MSEQKLTAMAALIDKLRKQKDGIKSDKFPDRCRKGAYTDAILLALSLLSQEREQMEGMCNEGIHLGHFSNPGIAQSTFDNNYKQTNKDK